MSEYCEIKGCEGPLFLCSCNQEFYCHHQLQFHTSDYTGTHLVSKPSSKELLMKNLDSCISSIILNQKELMSAMSTAFQKLTDCFQGSMDQLTKAKAKCKSLKVLIEANKTPDVQNLLDCDLSTLNSIVKKWKVPFFEIQEPDLSSVCVQKDKLNLSIPDFFYEGNEIYYFSDNQTLSRFNLDTKSVSEVNLEFDKRFETSMCLITKYTLFRHGGIQEGFKYNQGTITDLYTQKQQPLEKSPEALAFNSCIYKSGSVYIFGENCYKYTISLDNWTKISDLPLKLQNITCTCFKDEIIVTGSNSQVVYSYSTLEDRYLEFLTGCPFGTKLLCRNDSCAYLLEAGGNIVEFEEATMASRIVSQRCQVPSVNLLSPSIYYKGFIYLVFRNMQVFRFRHNKIELFATLGSHLTEESKEAVGMECPKNHTLTWVSTRTWEFVYSPESIGSRFVCFLCSSPIRKSGTWGCTICGITTNLCEVCGTSSGFPAPKILCEARHELKWYPDSFYYYKRTFLKSKKCNLCYKELKGGTWHCRNCYYDCCEPCGFKLGYSSPKPQLRCLRNHKIKSCTNLMSSCEICGQIKLKNQYGCNLCQYICCNSCVEFLLLPVSHSPVFRCSKGHILHWNTTYKANSFKCDMCKGTFKEIPYSCKKCRCDICVNCHHLFLTVVDQSKTCSKGHPLNWNFIEQNKDFRCLLCKRNFKKVGSFQCSCDVEICLECVSKI